MPTDLELKKDFNDRYQYAFREWDKYWTEASKDLKYCVGDQWDAREKAYLRANRREVLTFNKVRRIIQLLTGYQRQNRLGFKVEALEMAAEQTASQYSRLLLQLMETSGGFYVMSDAFENGALKTGMQLVEPCMNYADDPVNGDLRLRNTPFSRFLLDPNFTERDLSDCSYVLKRDWLTKDSAKALLPARAKEIQALHTKDQDLKFTYARKTRDAKDRVSWDEYWRREPVKKTVLVDMETGAWKWWPKNADKERLALFMANFPQITKREVYQSTVKLTILLNDEVFYDDTDPLEINEYPFVPVFGYFNPELENFSEKIMGVVRDIRDPQKEYNKRRSKILDIIDSQLSSGWMAEEDSVINKKDLYQSGQGKVVWLKSGAIRDQKVKEIRSPDIPAGLFQLEQALNQDMMDISGTNAELMGQPNAGEQRVAGFLAKMRQSQGLIMQQSLFDNYRLSKALLGHKLLKIIQQNYSPDKVQSILHEAPAEEFYNKKFGKYNVNVVETVLTDSQRQMYYNELVSLKELGAPIPWSIIVRAVPITYREELQQAVEQEEQAMAQQQQKQQELEQIWVQGEQAKTQDRLASSEMKKAQAEQNLAGAEFSRARALERLEKLPLERLEKLAKIMHELTETMGETAEMRQLKQQIGQVKGQRGLPPGGGGGSPMPQDGYMQQIIRNQMMTRR